MVDDTGSKGGECCVITESISCTFCCVLIFSASILITDGFNDQRK